MYCATQKSAHNIEGKKYNIKILSHLASKQPSSGILEV
jgi:hypothetical protein